MSYVQRTWINEEDGGQVTSLDAGSLNHIEAGIHGAAQTADSAVADAASAQTAAANAAGVANTATNDATQAGLDAAQAHSAATSAAAVADAAAADAATRVSVNGGSVINITDGGVTGTQALRINVPGGDRTTNETPNTFAVYFAGKLTGYLNEYGELRVIASDDSRVPLRVKQHSNTHSANLIEATNLANVALFSVDKSGKVTAPNIDRRVSYGSSQPTNPQIGDLWIQP